MPDDVPYVTLGDSDLVLILSGLDGLAIQGPEEVNMWMGVRNKIMSLRAQGMDIARLAAETEAAETETEAEADAVTPELAPQEVAEVTEG